MNEVKHSKKQLVDMHGSQYVNHFDQNRAGNVQRIHGILSNIEFNAKDCVVDYGCGNGFLFEQIHYKIQEYYGVDFSKEFIESFQSKISHWKPGIVPKLFCEDIVEFTKDKQHLFDKAFTLDFSEHLYDEDFKTIYTAICNSLKEKGQLIFHTPNGDFFLEWLKTKGIIKQHEQHIGIRNAAENIELLKGCGFHKIEVKYIAHYNVLKHLHPISRIPFIGSPFRARLLLICSKS